VEVIGAAIFSAVVGILSAIAEAAGPHLQEYHGRGTPLTDVQRRAAEQSGEIGFVLTYDVTISVLVLGGLVLAASVRSARAARDWELGVERPPPSSAPFVVDYTFALTFAQAFVVGGFLTLTHHMPVGFNGWELLVMAASGVLGLGACLAPTTHSRRVAIGAASLVLATGIGSAIAEPALFLRPSLALSIFAFVLLLQRPELALRPVYSGSG